MAYLSCGEEFPAVVLASGMGLGGVDFEGCMGFSEDLIIWPAGSVGMPDDKGIVVSVLNTFGRYLTIKGRSRPLGRDFSLMAAVAFLSSFLALTGTPLTAQTTLAKAVLMASERDPGIDAYRHEITRKDVDIQAVRDGRYPQLSLDADTSTTNNDGAGVTLTVSQLLFDWGSIKNKISSASQERLIAVSELKLAVESLTLDVSQYFIDIEVLDLKIARTLEYLDFANRIAGHAAARSTAGLGDNAEVARARLEVSRTEEQLTQLRSDRVLALAQLEFLMVAPPGTVVAPPELGFMTHYTDRASVQSAVRLSPDYIIAQARVARAEAEIAVARADRKPKIRLQAQVRADVERGGTRSSVGLATGVDLGAGNIAGRQVRSAELALEAANANLRATGRNIENAAQSARERIGTLRASERSQNEQLGEATAVLASYEEQFIGGQRELLDLLTTGRDLYDAQIDLISTYERRKRTEYEAAFDIGVLGTLILATSARGG